MNIKKLIDIPALLEPTKDRFDSTVTEVRGKQVLLNESFFFPNVSAQPCDTGVARWGDHESDIKRVELRNNKLWHTFVNAVPPAGTKVHCVIDWNRRKFISRLHTAAVLVSGVARDLWQCDVSSCSISVDRVRLDFTCPRKGETEVNDLLSLCNELITNGAEVTCKWIPVRHEVEYTSLYRSAATMRKVQNRPGRIVRIGNNGHTIERQFDIGTHVNNIRELGAIRLGSANGSHKKALENKGYNHFRIRFHIVEE